MVHPALASDRIREAIRRLPFGQIAVSGSTGLIGQRVCGLLSELGIQPVRLVRRPPIDIEREIQWNPDTGLANPASVSTLDGIIHLAGRSVAAFRWNARIKSEIRRSRVEATRRLVEQIAGLPQPPKTFVSASAIGLYGHQGEAWVDETTPPAEDFLGHTCRDWEAASQPLVARQVRVSWGRLGIILCPQGGALARLLPLAKLGLAGPVGTGQQYFSWFDLEDAAAALVWMALEPTAQGPYNLTAPAPVRQREFARELGRVLRRPSFLPMPAGLLRLLMGEMAQALLLQSCRVRPKRLMEAGFPFRNPELAPYLQRLWSA